jgi:hypothetical protein
MPNISMLAIVTHPDHGWVTSLGFKIFATQGCYVRICKVWIYNPWQNSGCDGRAMCFNQFSTIDGGQHIHTSLLGIETLSSGWVKPLNHQPAQNALDQSRQSQQLVVWNQHAQIEGCSKCVEQDLYFVCIIQPATKHL